MAYFTNSMIASIFLVLAFTTTIFAGNSKMVAYWGQQSASDEQRLSYYCQDDTYDILVVSFVYLWPMASGSSYPGMDFADHCGTSFTKTDPHLLNCPDIGTDIVYCQSRGKQVFISLGGADGTYGFTSDAQAQQFATMVWNMFLGGTMNYRPFGTAILDGVDLDIEKGATTGYVAFITALRTYFASASKPYYISSAPQCPYPDEWMGPGNGLALTGAWFDYVWVQFYNNFCGLNSYGKEFNFNSWAAWAKTSVNPNVKVIIGAPASASAAGTGYVSATQLQTIATAVAAQYPDVFGGIMLWDAGTAADNSNFGTVLGSFLHSSLSIPSTPSSTPSSSTTGAKTSTSTTTGAKVSSTSTTGAKGSSTSTTGAKSSTSTTGSKVPSTSTSTTGKVQSSTSTSGSAHGHSSSTSTSTTGSKVPSSSSSTPISSSACSLGDQRCSGTNSYQTCSYLDRDGNTYWAANQNCPSSLSCHASATGNNVYCY